MTTDARRYMYGATSGFNKYAAGNKRYGSGRAMPNIGKNTDTLGYAERDNRAQSKRDAILRRLKRTQRNLG